MMDGLPQERFPSTIAGSWWDQRSADSARAAAFEIVSCFAIDCGRTLLDLGGRLVPLRDYLAQHPTDEFLASPLSHPHTGVPTAPRAGVRWRSG